MKADAATEAAVLARLASFAEKYAARDLEGAMSHFAPDADVVMFVHREEYYHRGDDRAQYAGQAEIIIAKQRNGPIGDVELTWEADFTRFSDRAPERHSEFDDYAEFTAPGGF